MTHAKFTTEEITARGQEIYEQQIRSRVEAGNIGKYLVIDVETGDYELDENDTAALKRAGAKHPGGIFHLLRVGHPAVGRIGARAAHATRICAGPMGYPPQVAGS